MSRYLTIIIFVYINTINIGFAFRLNHYHSYQLNKLYNLKSTVNLYAKKKTNKLISDELWTSLEPEDEDKPAKNTSTQQMEKVLGRAECPNQSLSSPPLSSISSAPYKPGYQPSSPQNPHNVNKRGR